MPQKTINSYSKRMVLTATGPVFCAGFHLGELEASSSEDAASAELEARLRLTLYLRAAP